MHELAIVDPKPITASVEMVMQNPIHLIIDFQAGEGGVFKAHINADHVIHQSVGFVSFQR